MADISHSLPRRHLEYPEKTMFQMVEQNATDHPSAVAYEFFNKKTTYKDFVSRIEQAARAFIAAGIRRDDVVTICLPNVPQALICFYALDRIGAVANMVHPLSAQYEIAFYLNFSGSKMILTADMFCEKVEHALQRVQQRVTILVCRIQDELPFPLNIGYTVKTGRPHLKYPNTDHAMLWTKFLQKGTPDIPLAPSRFDPKHTAVILYSGGTSGTPKGICLSELNFNALACQTKEAFGKPLGPGQKMLSCMPVFHGFGLGINIHTILVSGAECILMPSFTLETYAQMLKKKQPNLIAGVPTLFEALLHIKELDGVDLSCLEGVFSGGDSITPELKKKVDSFLHEHGCKEQIREGYGLTECVTASCLTPRDTYRERSIGLPYPDTEYCIVRPGTDEELPRGEEGEIILTGPSVMLGYLKNEEETKTTLRVLPDGKTWLYTGDLGHMDEDGYIYFRQRIKRMIVTNGYNVYPGQLENVIDACPEVSYSCVIGVKDDHAMQRVKAYVVLRDGIEPSDEVKARILDRMKLHVAKYALPKEIEFRKELPKTLVGKVAYRKLEEENEGK